MRVLLTVLANMHYARVTARATNRPTNQENNMHTTNRHAPTATDLVDLLDLIEIRRPITRPLALTRRIPVANVFADVTSVDECGAPIGGGGLVPCENG